ncbi:MAG: J domain-containing protein [Actinomycetota bacterium]|nr:J domain-containing protein [Actinomycetota bacterium]
MILAELEVFHSRPIAPTRRLAIGRQALPCDPSPGHGGVLLAGIAAHWFPRFDHELDEELEVLMAQLEHGYRIVQPGLRHRLQDDHIGLLRTTHRLVRRRDSVRFEVGGEHGSPAHQILGAVYAAGRLPHLARADVMALLRRAMRWQGAVDERFYSAMVGSRPTGPYVSVAWGDPEGWARSVLGLDEEKPASRREIQQAFRLALRMAHPDHGGEATDAAGRIAELREARRILLP